MRGRAFNPRAMRRADSSLFCKVEKEMCKAIENRARAEYLQQRRAALSLERQTIDQSDGKIHQFGDQAAHGRPLTLTKQIVTATEVDLLPGGYDSAKFDSRHPRKDVWPSRKIGRALNESIASIPRSDDFASMTLPQNAAINCIPATHGAAHDAWRLGTPEALSTNVHRLSLLAECATAMLPRGYALTCLRYDSAVLRLLKGWPAREMKACVAA